MTREGYRAAGQRPAEEAAPLPRIEVNPLSLIKLAEKIKTIPTETETKVLFRTAFIEGHWRTIADIDMFHQHDGSGRATYLLVDGQAVKIG